MLFLLRGFGTGYTPRMPGTMGSFLALIFALPLWVWVGREGAMMAAIVFLALTILSALITWQGFRTYHREWSQFDPSDIVLDEFSGTFLVFAGLSGSGHVYWLLVGFVFFRLFDMFKPFPVDWVEGVGRFSGLVFDDVVAACLSVSTTGCFWYLLAGMDAF